MFPVWKTLACKTRIHRARRNSVRVRSVSGLSAKEVSVLGMLYEARSEESVDAHFSSSRCGNCIPVKARTLQTSSLWTSKPCQANVCLAWLLISPSFLAVPRSNHRTEPSVCVGFACQSFTRRTSQKHPSSAWWRITSASPGGRTTSEANATCPRVSLRKIPGPAHTIHTNSNRAPPRRSTEISARAGSTQHPTTRRRRRGQ